MSYPVAYRKGSEQYSSPPADERFRGFQAGPPQAANDNIVAANDNIVDLLPDEQRKQLTRRLINEIERQAVRRLAPKLVPYANALSLAYDAYEFYEWATRKDDVGQPIVTRRLRSEPDFRSWEWQAKHDWPDPSYAMYPPYQTSSAFQFVTWWYCDTGEVLAGSMTLAGLPGHAATIADGVDAVTHGYGAVYTIPVGWPHPPGSRSYQMQMPEVWMGATADDPWYETIVSYDPATEVPVLNPVQWRQARWESEAGEDDPAKDNEPYRAQDERPNEWALSWGSPDVAPGPAPVNHASTKPPKGTKERKFIANARGVIAELFGAMTEWEDFIRALWGALPKKYRTGYYKLHGKNGTVYYKRRRKAGLPEMQRDLWKHFDALDFNDAVWNVATNQLQDALIGKLGKAQQRAARDWLAKMGRPVGFGTGPGM